MKIVKRIGESVPKNLIGKRVKVTSANLYIYKIGDIYSVVEGFSFGEVRPRLYKQDSKGAWVPLNWNGLDAEFALVEEEEQLKLFV